MIEIPSFVAGLIAFLFVFLLMSIMFLVLRTEKDKTIPPLNSVGPFDVVKLENPLSSSDAASLAVMTLVTLELLLDALIVVGVLERMGSVAVGTMLAVATFLAAAILAVYRSTFMNEAFARKPRLENIAARLFKNDDKGDEHE